MESKDNFTIVETKSLLTIERSNKDKRIGLIRFKNAPVNILSLKFMGEIMDSLTFLEQDKSFDSVIITSGVPKVFSAGLDLTEMYNAKPDNHRKFWYCIQDLFMKLYISPLATVCAINGASPAGGCLLSLACDERLMMEGYNIGLNEVHLGICAPWWFAAAMEDVVGKRSSDKLIQCGIMASTKEAKKIGLIDYSFTNENEMIDFAIDELLVKQWMKVGSSHARGKSKFLMRQPLYAKLKNTKEEDWKVAYGFISDPAIQKVLGNYLLNLSKRKKRSKL